MKVKKKKIYYSNLNYTPKSTKTKKTTKNKQCEETYVLPSGNTTIYLSTFPNVVNNQMADKYLQSLNKYLK